MKGFILLIFAALGCEGQQAGLAGTVSGTVKGEDGTLLVGAKVRFERAPAPGLAPRQRIERDTTAGVGGVFQFDALPPGQYFWCAHVPSSVWLNPCEWGGTRPTVTILRGQSTASLTLVLRRGVVLPIRVDDAGQLLQQHEGKTPGAHLVLGVRNDALIFNTALITSQDLAGRNYQITIPFDKGVQLVVASSYFKLVDGAGTALAASVAIPVAAPSGTTPAAIHFAVTGAGK